MSSHSKNERLHKIVEVLRDMQLARGRPVPAPDLRAACEDFLPAATEAKRKSFSRSMRALLHKLQGRVAQTAQGFVVREIVCLDVAHIPLYVRASDLPLVMRALLSAK